jgi:hypothetical protein
MQEGKVVSIVPQMQEITTQRAANLLGVDASFLSDSLMMKNSPSIGQGPTGGYI